MADLVALQAVCQISAGIREPALQQDPPSLPLSSKASSRLIGDVVGENDRETDHGACGKLGAVIWIGAAPFAPK